MESRLGRHRHQSEIDPATQRRNRFARIKRQLFVMERQGVTPPSELLQEQITLDQWLTNNTPWWISHFGLKREQLPTKVQSGTKPTLIHQC